VLWSAQDDRQLIGCVSRRGQQAACFIYRLILKGTTDVFLNNLSYAKADVLKGFTSADYAPGDRVRTYCVMSLQE
jgi:hypothetical protein